MWTARAKLTLGIIALAGLVQEIATSSCTGNGWVKRPGSESCYKFVTTPTVNWNTAVGLCMDLGGYPAALETVEEIVWLHGYRSYHSELNKNPLWVGGHRRDGKWYWKNKIADAPMLVADWAPGEPTSTPQHCLQIYGEQKDDAYWSNYRFDNDYCIYLKGYVCEKPAK